MRLLVFMNLSSSSIFPDPLFVNDVETDPQVVHSRVSGLSKEDASAYEGEECCRSEMAGAADQ